MSEFVQMGITEIVHSALANDLSRGKALDRKQKARRFIVETILLSAFAEENVRAWKRHHRHLYRKMMKRKLTESMCVAEVARRLLTGDSYIAVVHEWARGIVPDHLMPSFDAIAYDVRSHVERVILALLETEPQDPIVDRLSCEIADDTAMDDEITLEAEFEQYLRQEEANREKKK